MDPHPDSRGLPPDTQDIFDVQEDAKENTDEEISDLMADPEVVEADDGAGDDTVGSVEGIIPPSVDNEDGVESEEEHFSIEDFEEGFAEGENGQGEGGGESEESEPDPDSASAHDVPAEPAPQLQGVLPPTSFEADHPSEVHFYLNP